jgi:hypothetical protein
LEVSRVPEIKEVREVKFGKLKSNNGGERFCIK